MPVSIFENEIKVAYRLMIMNAENKLDCFQKTPFITFIPT